MALNAVAVHFFFGRSKGSNVDIREKVVVITGGASGIGAAMARQFATDGAGAVVVLDLDGAGAEVVAAEVGGRAMQLDVSDDAATSAAMNAIETEFGRIDILCLNAGIATAGSVDTPNDVWQRTWEVNLMAHVYATRYVLPGMLERGSGYLVHTASAAGLLTNLGAAPYSVTKHAAVALAEWLSVTYGDRGIGVSALCPQFVETPMLDAFANRSEEMRSWVHDMAVSPEQVAVAVMNGIRDETFLILPHPDVATYFERKATDYDRWIAGMRSLQASMDPVTD
jgi:NAD(P)-dependent dehydrogenase (short-subunit alcohol dehydrogenase family)